MKHSLNISVAAGIVLWELSQKQLSPRSKIALSLPNMSTAKNYLSLIKFSHTIFAMPFAMIGFFLAVFNYPFSVEAMEFR